MISPLVAPGLHRSTPMRLFPALACVLLAACFDAGNPPRLEFRTPPTGTCGPIGCRWPADRQSERSLTLDPVDVWGGSSSATINLVNMGGGGWPFTLSTTGAGISASATKCDGTAPVSSPFSMSDGDCLRVRVTATATPKTSGDVLTGTVKVVPLGQQGVELTVTAPLVDSRNLALCTTGHEGDDGDDIASRCVDLRPGRIALPLGFSGSESGVLKRLRFVNHGQLDTRFKFLQPTTMTTAIVDGPVTNLLATVPLPAGESRDFTVLVSSVEGAWSLPGVELDGRTIELVDTAAVPRASPLCLSELRVLVREGAPSLVDLPVRNCAPWPIQVAGFTTTSPVTAGRTWAPATIPWNGSVWLPLEVSAPQAQERSLLTVQTQVADTPVVRAMLEVKPIAAAPCELTAAPLALGDITPVGASGTFIVRHTGGGACGAIDVKVTGPQGSLVHVVALEPLVGGEALWTWEIPGPLGLGELRATIEARLAGSPTAPDLRVPVSATVVR